MTEYEKKILKRFDILLKILSVNMKFKLDNSSYKSKTPTEIKSTAPKENEILNSLHEGTKGVDNDI